LIAAEVKHDGAPFWRRVALLTAGWTCIALGFAGLFLPVLQGILLLAIGLLLLSAEYHFARKWMRWLRLRYPSVRPVLRHHRLRFLHHRSRSPR
jgi:uncharacterized membrane protein YbaN (DUF454 family)